MKVDWKKDVKDTMWSMFWIRTINGTIGTDNDKEALKENVARLIRMTTQKTAGQRGVSGHINWNALEHTIMTIVCSAAALALAGEFGEMPEYIEETDE